MSTAAEEAQRSHEERLRARYAPYRVPWPEAQRGPWRIEHFEIDRQAADFWNLRQAFQGSHRDVVPDTYTRLKHDQRGTVMSDTPSEIRDHFEFFRAAEWMRARRLLIHGLGLGMATRYVLSLDHVEHVDVVELDPDVIGLVGVHFMLQIRSGRLTIHEGDALTYRFPPGTRWDLAWHDIWDSISEGNISEIARLKRRYGGRVQAQYAWVEQEVRDLRRGYGRVR